MNWYNTTEYLLRALDSTIFSMRELTDIIGGIDLVMLTKDQQTRDKLLLPKYYALSNILAKRRYILAIERELLMHFSKAPLYYNLNVASEIAKMETLREIISDKLKTLRYEAESVRLTYDDVTFGEISGKVVALQKGLISGAQLKTTVLEKEEIPIVKSITFS